MKNGFLIALAAVIAAVVVVSACRLRRSGDEVSVGSDDAVTVSDASRQVAVCDISPHGPVCPSSRRPTATGRPPTKVSKPVLDLSEDEDDEENPFLPEEKRLAERIEKALDEEKLDDALACASLAVRCPRREIREAMIDTLGWFGAKALPELTPFLADSDADLAESAFDEWSMALSDIEDDAEKIATVERAMEVLTNEDHLDDISNEYIGVDEKLAVESLARIIAAEGSANGVAKAKETYEFVTGDEWQGEAEAERWLREEYEPDTDE